MYTLSINFFISSKAILDDILHKLFSVAVTHWTWPDHNYNKSIEILTFQGFNVVPLKPSQKFCIYK